MIEYINTFHEQVVSYLAKHVPHREIVTCENGVVGLLGAKGLLIEPHHREALAEICDGREFDDEIREAITLKVKKSFYFDKEGDREGEFLIYESGISYDLDIMITRALAALNKDFGVKTTRHDEENGRIKYYACPKQGPMVDTDLGEFDRTGDELVAALEQVPPSGDATEAIVNRAEVLKRSLLDLPNWNVYL